MTDLSLNLKEEDKLDHRTDNYTDETSTLACEKGLCTIYDERDELTCCCTNWFWLWSELWFGEL
ncbi:hypothetical protein GAMM_200002 [Gammaproteobacteria bacterium]